MDTWDEYCLAENEVSDLLDGGRYILFFKKGDNVFGAPEESRVIFAKLKNPDDDITQQWKDEAKFVATNLLQSVMGQPVDTMFGCKDVKDMEVMDRDKVMDLLIQKKTKKEKK